MKKYIMLSGLLVLFFQSSTFASNARMKALGQSSQGSYYIEDTRNIFLNPAKINVTKKYIVTDWGLQDDAEGGVQGHGGLVKEVKDFVVGFYFNNQTALDQNWESLKEQTDKSANYISGSNGVDLFLGGDMGFQWGVRVNYTQNKDNMNANEDDKKLFNLDAEKNYSIENEYSAVGLGLGATAGAISGHLNFILADVATTTVNKIEYEKKQKLGMDAGVSWMVNPVTLYGNFSSNEYEYDTRVAGVEAVEEVKAVEGKEEVKADTDKNIKAEEAVVGVEAVAGVEGKKAKKGEGSIKRTVLNVGVAKSYNVNAQSKLVFDIGFSLNKQEQDDKLISAKVMETTTTLFPVKILFETDATSWLTLRGSVVHNLFFGSKKVDEEEATGTENTTNVYAGLTFNFDKLKVDSVVGVDGKFNFADSFMSEVAVIFWY